MHPSGPRLAVATCPHRRLPALPRSPSPLCPPGGAPPPPQPTAPQPTAPQPTAPQRKVTTMSLMPRWHKRAMAALMAAGLALLGVSLAAPAQAATCTTYYVSTSGSNSNSGCSSSAPWATLAKVNATTFAAGNQILFARGGSWTGELHPLGSGSSGNPVVISSYGSGSAPIIAGGGAAAAVYLDNQQHWTIENLEITNTTTSAAIRSGTQLENDTR